MLKIGSRGFTLIEVMAATVVLSLGTLFIYDAFFLILDSVNYYSDFLAILPSVGQKLWEAQESIRLYGNLSRVQTAGAFEMYNKRIEWRLQSNQVDEGGGGYLYQIEMSNSWREGRRNVKLSRTAYAIYREKE